MKKILPETCLEMLRLAATDLPPDVEQVMRDAARREAGGTAASAALGILIENIAMARAQSRPMCQDTGTNTWWIRHPENMSGRVIRSAVVAATRKAVKAGFLRPNSVDSVTGQNSGDGTGLLHPVVHLEQWARADLALDLLLKGGGCENVSAQMALPDVSISAGRDLEGVRRAVLLIVQKAQGKGCSPGVLGICIGGDRATGFAAAKEQLLRPLRDRNPDPLLADLEKRILAEANTLGVGPMGFGGATTLLGVKAVKAHRLPASFFVTVAYSCWSLRRAHARISRGRAAFAREPFVHKGR